MKWILKLFKTFVIHLCMLSCLLGLGDVQASDCMLDDWIISTNKDCLCGGYYQQSTPTPPPTGTLQLYADQGFFKPEGTSTLEGHAKLLQTDRQITSDRALIHRDTGRDKALHCIEAFGNVHITEPGLRVDGTQAKLLVVEEEKTVDNAAYRLYDQHGRGEAKQLRIHQKTRLFLDKASYTTCAPCNNAWMLKAKHLDLNKTTGRGKAYHSTLYVKEVPIFYLPYFNFPIDDRRQTGFLQPEIGSRRGSGLSFAAPFYWNIAPNYDATLTPQFFSKRGAGLQGLFRYLQPHNHGELEGFFLPQDKAYQNFKAQKKANHPGMANNDPRLQALRAPNHRGALGFNHQLNPSPSWQSNLRYHKVLDDNYFMDFGNSLSSASTTQLLQEADLIYQQPQWSLKTRLQQYQTLHPFDGPANAAVYKQLPQIALQQRSDLPLGFSFRLQGDFTHFAHEPTLDHTLFTTGNRLYMRPSLSLPLRKVWGSLTPKIQWNALAYHLQPGPSNPSQNARAHLGVPMLSVDSRLFFERPLFIGKENYTQTLEPRAYYLQVPFRNQQGLPNFDTGYSGFSANQLYWDNRFSGLDRIGDTQQLTLGLSSGFIQKSSGLEPLRLSLGQIRYFKRRKVQSATNNLDLGPEAMDNKTRHSSIVGEAHYQIQESWTTAANTLWNSTTKRSDQTGLSIQYHPEPLAVVNVGYQFLRINPLVTGPNPEALKQTDSSIAWPLNPRWRILGRWHYDIVRKHSNDLSFGIEQQGCCTAVRLLATRFLKPYDPNQSPANKQYTNAVFIQWVFKGLGTFGDNTLGSTLKRNIPDYQPWSDRHF